jgi:hypothetical protein
MIHSSLYTITWFLSGGITALSLLIYQWKQNHELTIQDIFFALFAIVIGYFSLISLFGSFMATNRSIFKKKS